MADAIHNRRRHDGPRRIRNGLKLRHALDEGLPWPTAVWRDALLAPIDPVAIAAGLEYARAGQTASLVILPPEDERRPEGPQVRVEASVQGRSARPYKTVVGVHAWTRDQWHFAVEAMAREAIYAAKLLTGELPPAIEDLCRSIELPLLPRPSEPFAFECTCVDPKPCKHHATLTYLLAERMSETPMLAFNLRGMPHETALARLQEARALHTHGRSTAHVSAGAKVAARPFTACLADLGDFWRPGPQLAEIERAPANEHVSHALLRRLGPSPMQGRFPLVGLLASIYDSVRESAKRLREEIENGRGLAEPPIEATSDKNQ